MCVRECLRVRELCIILVQDFGAEDDECVRFMSERETHMCVEERHTCV